MRFPRPEQRSESQRATDEQGAVTAFVVVFAFALLLVAGLVVDGGTLLNARRTAINEAEAAARAGAQGASDGGAPGLDPVVATNYANAYLVKTGRQGTVAVSGDAVTVKVSFDQPMAILGAGGLASVTIHGEGSARQLRGVSQEGDLQ